MKTENSKLISTFQEILEKSFNFSRFVPEIEISSLKRKSLGSVNFFSIKQSRIFF